VIPIDVHRAEPLKGIVERIAMLALLCLGISLQSRAQDALPAQAASLPASEAGAPDPQAPQEVLQELDAMKHRIEELEAQLRQHGAEGQPTAPTSKAPSTTPSAALPTAATETFPSSQPPSSAEPFAFADWTWLNGNPRTKEAAFDSKFFTPEIRADVAYHYDFNHPQDDTIGGFVGSENGVTPGPVGHIDRGFPTHDRPGRGLASTCLFGSVILARRGQGWHTSAPPVR